MFAVPKPRRPSNRITIEKKIDGKQYRSMQEYIAVQSAFVRLGWSQQELRPETSPVEIHRTRFLESGPRLP
jgi:hypothetical protein